MLQIASKRQGPEHEIVLGDIVNILQMLRPWTRDSTGRYCKLSICQGPENKIVIPFKCQDPELEIIVGDVDCIVLQKAGRLKLTQQG